MGLSLDQTGWTLHKLQTFVIWGDQLLKTRLCDVLGIDVPIILAAMGGTASSAEFAAATSNEGALGSIGSLFRATDVIKRDVEVVKKLTNRNFAVNHIPPTLDTEAFRHTLAARPAVISFALGDPGDLVRQAHDVGFRSQRSGRRSRQPNAVPTS